MAVAKTRKEYVEAWNAEIRGVHSVAADIVHADIDLALDILDKAQELRNLVHKAGDILVKDGVLKIA